MKKACAGPLKILLYISVLVLAAALGSVSACKQVNKLVSGHRYVVLSPELAEIIAAIEGTDNIIGITEECNYPEALKSKTVVGKFGTLDKEAIIALKPSLVFASSLEQQAIAAELSKLDIRVVTVYPKTINEMLQGIITVGKAIGKEERAKAVADTLYRSLELTRTMTINIPRPKVYLEIYREPLMSVSDKSFVGELIELAGGDNIFSELERDYSRVKAEDVIKANPDVIICYSQDSMANIKRRMGWQNITAVKNNHIYFEKDINPDWILRAGPRCHKGAYRLFELIHEVRY
jgi:ABC-type Fe3+-hydroxamate transport system substrate-binding protein